jgi:hypothetical protein
MPSPHSSCPVEVAPGDGERAVARMRAAGAILADSGALAA